MLGNKNTIFIIDIITTKLRIHFESKHARTHTLLYAHANTHTRTHACTNVCTHVHLHAHEQSYTHTRTRTHANTHTHTRAHVGARTNSWSLQGHTFAKQIFCRHFPWKFVTTVFLCIGYTWVLDLKMFRHN